MDDKGTLIGVLEAVEMLLGESFQPTRTLYIASGHDEEIGGANGAAKVAEYLKSKGVQAAMTIDEGGFITEGLIPGIEKTVAVINLSEKGYATFKLTICYLQING